MDRSLLAHVETTVASGLAIMAGDDATVVATVQDTISRGRSANFYLSRTQAQAVKSWYWTPERISGSRLEPISAQEQSKIENTLGVRNMKDFRFSPINCTCGAVYGAFEFLQQGVQEHGIDMVNAVFALEHTSVLRVNPTFVPICPSCEQVVPRDDGCITYEGDTYAGCSYCEQPR